MDRMALMFTSAVAGFCIALLLLNRRLLFMRDRRAKAPLIVLTFAVLGNHDYWAGADAVRPAIRKAGITLLTDDSVRLQMEGGTIQITGCDYPWSGATCVVPESPDGVLRLVLSHTPDNIYRISKQSAHFVFSGHYHAGQLRIPFLGPIVVPSVYGRRFDHGHFVVHGTHLFVASGVGAASPPFRLYCEPDIFVVDVTGEAEGIT